ncbi:hypothetical protein D3C87_1370750 [compost metagenome]
MRAHHAEHRQPGHDNPHARAAEHQPAQRGVAQFVQPLHAPRGSVDHHQRTDHARNRAPCQPRGHAARQRHGQREHHGEHQRHAHHAHGIGADKKAQQRAQQVADVVQRGQRPAFGQRDGAVVQHHRQQRREGKAADAHGQRHRHEAGQGHRPRSGGLGGGLGGGDIGIHERHDRGGGGFGWRPAGFLTILVAFIHHLK